MTDQQPPLSIRIPDELRAELQAAADKNIRSLGAEIRFRLEESLRNEVDLAGIKADLAQIKAALACLLAKEYP